MQRAGFSIGLQGSKRALITKPLKKDERGKYAFPYRIVYYSERYGKRVTVPAGYPTDGATGAIDIFSHAWPVHDVLCDRGAWDDGTAVTNWQASQVLSDILEQEGRRVRAFYWKWATFFLGGGEARKNGMVKVKNQERGKAGASLD